MWCKGLWRPFSPLPRHPGCITSKGVGWSFRWLVMVVRGAGACRRPHPPMPPECSPATDLKSDSGGWDQTFAFSRPLPGRSHLPQTWIRAKARLVIPPCRQAVVEKQRPGCGGRRVARVRSELCKAYAVGRSDNLPFPESSQRHPSLLPFQRPLGPTPFSAARPAIRSPRPSPATRAPGAPRPPSLRSVCFTPRYFRTAAASLTVPCVLVLFWRPGICLIRRTSPSITLFQGTCAISEKIDQICKYFDRFWTLPPCVLTSSVLMSPIPVPK